MSFVAVAIGGAVAGLGGAIINSNATRSAAAAQSDAVNAANATQAQQYNQTRADQAPWRDAGVSALNQIQTQMPELTRKFSMSDFNADPGYNFRMSEGQKAIERSAAARGGLNSGATMKALTRFGQDTASGEYNNAYNRFNNDQTNRFNRLSSVAGIGQNANNQVANAGQNMANQVGQNQTAAGNASAASGIANANNVSGVLGNGMNTWMQASMMNRMFPQVPSTPSYGGFQTTQDFNPSLLTG